MTPSLTQALARHIASSRFEQLPEATVRATRLALLDAIGVSLAASALGEGVAAFADLARSQGGAPQAAVLGFGFHAPVQAAVMANGSAAHALDFEDAFDGAPVHPNAAVVPVVLALGEQLDASGVEVLTALAVGCDLICRLGLALEVNPDEAGWYPPPILSTFGAAAAAARLLQLNLDQTVSALSLALNQATATAQFKAYPASTLRSIRDAFPAQAGLVSALLAQRGIVGFDGVFEGKAGFFNQYAQGRCTTSELLDGLGDRFHGERLSFKPWPSCRGTHAFIEAALELREQHGLPPDGIAEITATGGLIQRMLAEPQEQKQAPKTAIDGKFSIPFTTATALVTGRVTLDDFTGDALNNADVLSLSRRCQYRLDPQSTMRDAASGALQIRMLDGRVFERRIERPRGAPENPISEQDLAEKFRDCARRAATPMAADSINATAESILSLDRCAAVRRVFSNLSGAPQN